MLKKLLFTLGLLVVGVATTVAQTGGIKVKLVDVATKEPIPFANIGAELNGTQVAVGQTDFDGYALLKPLTPGKYNIKAVYSGYKQAQLNGILVSADKTTSVEIKMETGVTLTEVVIQSYSVPLIDPDTKTGQTVTRDQFQNMATKSINSVASTAAGTFQADEGDAVSIRGTRADGTDTYVDGQRIIGGSVPQQAVEQITVVTGGLPAQYGDATGGIISITTRGPQSVYFGGVELVSSQLTDKYDYNFAGFTVGGPLMMKTDSNATEGKTSHSILGFIVSGEGTTELDPDPSAVGSYRVKDEALENVRMNPLRPSRLGQGFVRSGEFITANDIESIKIKQNTRNRTLRLNGKLDYQPAKNLNLTVGGSFDHTDRHLFDFNNALFNYENNVYRKENVWRGYIRATQKFTAAANTTEGEKSTSLFKGAYLTFQASYSNLKRTDEDESHQNDYFKYGHVGKFNLYRAPSFEFRDNGANALNGPGFYQNGFTDTLYTFEPGTYNPYTTAYTEQFYNLSQGTKIFTPGQVRQGLGLLNGDSPQSVYSLWNNTGTQANVFRITDNTQYRATLMFNADIGNHALMAGLEYEQRDDRLFSLAPVGLWTLMRQYANLHLTQLDTAPIYSFTQNNFNYYTFDTKYVADDQTQFDKSLREKLGLSVTDTRYLDVDSYDPNMYTLDMFSADELLNNGNSVVNYFGYDHTGKRTKGRPSFDDFFNKKDSRGVFSRDIGSFNPIYVAGFIEDKFDFDDIKFRIGLRADRYDANQKVLKDPFLLAEAKTAGEVKKENIGKNIPGNIGDDYVVYINDNNASTKEIRGFRSGNRWFNAQGVELTNGRTVAESSTSGRITPYLVNTGDQSLTEKVFKDFDPQVIWMPRIAFSFPISEMAEFTAHYDILTQRPSTGFVTRGAANRLDLTGYKYIQNQVGSIINNPDLRAERTVEYEVGFKQVLNERKNSALTLGAFYRQLKDMIQVVNYSYAYPVDYSSFANLDFGTIKGFQATYDLRRTGGIQLMANYTLQFAEGTGSSATDNLNLLNTDVPNIRNLKPLDFDQRHTITSTIDYRFGMGPEYRGPVWVKNKGKENERTVRLLSNVGANVTFRAGSGVPYSRQSNVTQEAAFGIQQRSVLKGTLNGSNLPWQYRMDLRIDKTIPLAFGKKEDMKAGNVDKLKVTFINIYVQVLNVLNTQNIISVYRYTGNPNDDGYLSAASSQNAINAQVFPQAFREQYSIKVNDPDNFSIPRRIRLGLTWDF